jgi:hypothetical protein
MDKVRETRLRRMARRQGLNLAKSRRRDPSARDFGKFWLIADRDRTAALGGLDGADLKRIEAWLFEDLR